MLHWQADISPKVLKPWASLLAMARKLQAEEALFAMVEKLTQTASLASNRRNLKVASSCLRRAYGLCSKQVEAGHLAGRVARTLVSLQLCALSSKAGQHAGALEEALNATAEAEEVWSLMQALRRRILQAWCSVR